MAEISKITLPSGTTYDIKDAVARQSIAGGVSFKGVTTTPLSDGSSTNPIQIGGSSYTAVNGDLVLYENSEFLFSSADSKWHEFGNLTGLGDLAFKDTAAGTFTPSGNVSKPGVTVTPTTTTIAEFDGTGTVTPGSANVPTAVTLPTMTMSVTSEVLTIAWADGSVTPGTANTPTAVTLPTSKNTTVMTGASAELAAAPTFTGTAGAITVS